MSLQLLEDLGLSPNEAKVYNTLLTFGGSGVSQLAKRSKVHRSNTYDTVYRLLEKGFVYEVFQGRESTFEAVDPKKFRELLDEKHRELDKALPKMSKLFVAHQTPERAQIFKGIEGVKNYIRLALEVGEDMYTLGGKCALSDPRLQSFTESFMNEFKKKKLKKYNLFDFAVKEECSQKELKTVCTDYKFLPENHQTNSILTIFGEYIITFTDSHIKRMGEDMTIFVIASEKLAEDHRRWWQLLWDMY